MGSISVKRWLMFGLFFVFDAILALRTSIPFFSFLFWFFVSIVFLSALFMYVAWYGLRVTIKRVHTDRVDENEVFEVDVEIENISNIPVFNLILEDNLSCAPQVLQKQYTAVDYLPFRYPILVRYTCVCEKRGGYRLGPCVAFVFDILGLFFLKKVLPETSDVYVYPKLFHIEKFPALTKGTVPWFGIGTTRSSGGDDEFFGTRDYRSGDTIKSIHWISTARQNKLIVKEFQRQNFFRATIVFNLAHESNLGEGKETVAEYIIRIAASVSRYLLENDIAVEVIAHTGEIVHIPSNKGGEHLNEILKFLTLAQPQSNISIGEIFEEFLPYIAEDSNLIVIMLDRDWEIFVGHAGAARRNVSILPLILLASSFVSAYNRPEILTKAKVKFAQKLDMEPLVFSAGENPENNFFK
jgi:uncharacterized protein (DUF58 family)